MKGSGREKRETKMRRKEKEGGWQVQYDREDEQGDRKHTFTSSVKSITTDSPASLD